MTCVLKGHCSPGLPFCSHFPLHHCVASSHPSLLNCLANISARERQISLFPVDIVLSELAVTALIIQHLFFFSLSFLSGTLPPFTLVSPLRPLFLLLPFFLFISFLFPPHSHLQLCEFGVCLSLMLRTSQLRGDATGALRSETAKHGEPRSYTVISRQVSPN